MKSKKFLAALTAMVAVGAVATTGLTVKADDEFVDAAPVDAAPAVVETPAVVEAPAVVETPAPIVSEPVVTESVAAPEPADTVVSVDETPAVSAVEDVPAEEVAATEAATEAADAEATTEEATDAEVTEEIPDAEKLEDHNGYNMSELAKISTEATVTTEKKKAVDYNQIYADYVNDEVVKKIDVAALEPDKKNPEKDYVRKELLGLVSAEVYDFGNDGVDELVTVTREQLKEYEVEVDNGDGTYSKVKHYATDDNNTASFMLNLYQYNRDDDKVVLIGRQTLGSYDLTYAGYSRPWGTSAYTEWDNLEGENDSQFQLAIVGDSIYFVQEQNTDLKSEDDKDPNGNRITHKIFQVNTRSGYDLADAAGVGGSNDVYGKDIQGGAIYNPYVLNVNRTTVTEVTQSGNYNTLYVNTNRYKKLTGNDYPDTYGAIAYTPDLEKVRSSFDEDGNVVYYYDGRYDEDGNPVQYTGAVQYGMFDNQQDVTEWVRDRFEAMKVPVNYAFIVDDVYNDDTIYADVRFAQEDVTMLTQYQTSPKFTTVDFTPVHGNAVHPAGTSEGKSGSSNGGSSKSGSSSNGGTTSSPNTGDSRVPVAAGAAAVAAAAAAVAFVSKKRG